MRPGEPERRRDRLRPARGVRLPHAGGVTAKTRRDHRDLRRGRTAGCSSDVVALRGDPPKGETSFKAVEGGLQHANELVSLIRADFGDSFGLAVAGYPETHQEAPSPEDDLKNLKRI